MNTAEVRNVVTILFGRSGIQNYSVKIKPAQVV